MIICKRDDGTDRVCLSLPQQEELQARQELLAAVPRAGRRWQKSVRVETVHWN